MKIVNREEFLRLPSGTIYAEYDNYIFESLSIKGDSLFSAPGKLDCIGDFYLIDIASSVDAVCSEDLWGKLREMASDGASFPVDLKTATRDGEYEDGQLYAVWEKEDIQSLIAVLQKSLLNFN